MIAIKDLIKDYVLVSVCAFVMSVILTPIIRRLCQQQHLFDFPGNPRKIHSIPIPRLGGIGIYAAFYVPLFLLFAGANTVATLFAQNLDTVLSLFMTSSLVFAIGVYDDLRGATVLQKLVVQVIAAVALYFLGFQIRAIALPFFGALDLDIMGLPVTVLWLVGITNALNFIDGIDGLACGVGFFAVSTMFILSLFLNHPLTAFFAVALAGGLFGFMLYNFNPASIFMGDSGSLFIGFIIAAISLEGAQKSSTAVLLLIPIIVLGVPIADTLLAIIRRVGKGNSPFMADKEHIHHRLLNLGLSSRQVTLILYGVCSSLGITALLMTAVNNQVLTLILIVLSVMTIGGIKMLGYTSDFVEIQALARHRIERKRLLLQRQKCVDEIFLDMEHVQDLTAFQKVIFRYFEVMDLDIGRCVFFPDLCQSLSLKGWPLFEHQSTFIWQSLRYEERHVTLEQIWTISVPLIVQQKKCGELVIGKALHDAAFATALVEISQIVGSLKIALEQKLAVFVES